MVSAGDGVGNKVRSGLKWGAIGMASTRMSKFGAYVVLAHLLELEDFGVVAMANAAIVLMASLREAGLGQAYVQREPRKGEGPTEAADTMFVCMLVLNTALFGLVLALAPAVASFFDKDSLAVEPVMRVLAGLFLLDTFISTPQFLLLKRMAFDRIARAELAAALAHASIAIVSAFAGAGVWALVAGQIGSRFVLGLSLSWGARWRPGFRGSRRVASDLISYGKYLWGYALVRSISAIIDRVVIGKFHGASSLGGYNQAYNLCSLPSTLIAQLVNRVALPAMSRMQNDIARLRAAFLKSLEHVAFLALPAGLGLIAVSDVFVPVVYGDKWLPIVPLVDVLAIYSVSRAIASVCGPAMQALGRPKIFFYTELARQAFLVSLLVAFARNGAIGVAWSVLASMLAASIAAFAILSRLLDARWQLLAGRIINSLVASVGMFLAVLAVRRFLGAGLAPWAELILAIFSGVVAYALLSAASNARMLQAFLATVREVGASKSVSS